MLTLASYGLQVSPKPTQLVAILGQSNALGKSNTYDNTNTSGITDPYPNVVVRQQIARANTVPTTFDSFEARPLEPRAWALQADATIGNMGAELTLFRALDALGAAKWRCAKFAVGSSDATQWSPDSTSSQSASNPNYYTLAVQYLRESERMFGCALSALIWWQGETDSNNVGLAATYQAQTTKLFTRLLKIWPALQIVMVQTHASTGTTQLATIRAAQSAIATAMSANVTLINFDDLALQGDNLHYTADSYATAGTRLATTIAALTLGTASSTPTNGKWTVDATSGKAKPRGPWEWQNFLAANSIILPVAPGVPAYHLQCDDPATTNPTNPGDGNAHDSIGGLVLTAAGSPVLETAVTGWASKGIGFGGTGAGTGMKLTAATGLGASPATTSILRIVRFKAAHPTAEKNCWHNTLAAPILAVNMTTAGLLKVYTNSLNYSTVNDHGTGAVMCAALRFNRTAGTVTLLTSLEKLVCTYAATTPDNTKGIGDLGGGAHTGLVVLDDITFTGANAELTDGQVKLLLQGLGESPPW